MSFFLAIWAILLYKLISEYSGNLEEMNLAGGI